jgi:hypothetical protein
MTTGPIELYRPRAVAQLGMWEVGYLKLKVYGVVVVGKELTSSMIDDAHSFVAQDLPPLVLAEGDDNGLGFVIIHPGDLGISVLVHWWIQGSVLCQHIRRTLWGADGPMDTVTRPVIACVWELALINAEQQLWRETMMTGRPDSSSYLNARATILVV